ncbi:MAG: hypothetical protein BRD55_06530 [Bacteroidetes bacterium SW_9_63_38]|nr:MAG: hypothetical protein BRD55_06530 [Bacteroidetes bacterium SW_9_63_38]
MGRPAVTQQCHVLPRAGSAPDDAEDAVALRADAWPVRAAVADGATESVYAGLWAQMLVDVLVDVGADPGDVGAAIREQQAEWGGAVQERAAEQPWYVQSKAAEGAFATGLVLSVREGGTWAAASIGDCALFHLHDDRADAWPTDDPDAYTNRPALVPSRGTDRIPVPETATGTWAPGDTFLLATDAVAAWLLRVGPRSVLDADESFEGAVEHARAGGALRNDDATLCILKMEDLPKDDTRSGHE